MPNESGKEREISANDLVDYVYPFDRLLGWAGAALSDRRETGKRGGNPEIFPDLRKITTHPDFERTRFGLDVSIVQPSTGLTRRILYGSFFYPADLGLLEDPELNKVLEETIGAVEERLDRDQFQDALFSAIVMVTSTMIPHGLSQQELQNIVQTHLLPINLWDPVAQDWRRPVEAALLVYAAMKVIANRLDHSSELRPTQ